MDIDQNLVLEILNVLAQRDEFGRVLHDIKAKDYSDLYGEVYHGAFILDHDDSFFSTVKQMHCDYLIDADKVILISGMPRKGKISITETGIQYLFAHERKIK